MRFLPKIVRKYPVTTLVVMVIWVLCLVPIPQTPLSGLTLVDKWTHIIMYLVLSMIVGIEYWRNTHSQSFGGRFLYVFLLPVVMGGLLEIIQATATCGMRSGEWLDFAADTCGSAIAFVICILLARCYSRA